MNPRSLSPPNAQASDQSTRWHREPLMWLIVGLPAIAVLACAVSVTLAFRYADVVLDQSVRRDESSIRLDAKADALAHELGVNATVDTHGSQWVVHLNPGSGPLPDQLIVTVFDATQPQNDQRLTYERSLGRDYVGAKPKGVWNRAGEADSNAAIRLEIAPIDHSWRLMADVIDGNARIHSP